MAEHSRYHVSDEKAGINKSILKNKLGIKSKKKLDSAETLLLADTYAYFFELLKEDKVKFDLSLLFTIHNEFNIIHPFREGNGRTIRLFLDLIVVSIGYDPIDWSKTQNSEYIRACIQGFSNKQLAMIKIIKRGLKKSK